MFEEKKHDLELVLKENNKHCLPKITTHQKKGMDCLMF